MARLMSKYSFNNAGLSILLENVYLLPLYHNAILTRHISWLTRNKYEVSLNWEEGTEIPIYSLPQHMYNLPLYKHHASEWHIFFYQGN